MQYSKNFLRHVNVTIINYIYLNCNYIVDNWNYKFAQLCLQFFLNCTILRLPLILLLFCNPHTQLILTHLPMSRVQIVILPFWMSYVTGSTIQVGLTSSIAEESFLCTFYHCHLDYSKWQCFLMPKHRTIFSNLVFVCTQASLHLHIYIYLYLIHYFIWFYCNLISYFSINISLEFNLFVF